MPRDTLAKKMLLQPKCWVKNPPKNGPRDSPKFIATAFIPRTFPCSPAGNTEVRITNIIALPIPCNILKEISMTADVDTAGRKDERV